jgi:hypothetical protein
LHLCRYQHGPKALGKEIHLKCIFALLPILFKPLHCSKDAIIKVCLIYMTKAPLPQKIGGAEVVGGILE